MKRTYNLNIGQCHHIFQCPSAVLRFLSSKLIRLFTSLLRISQLLSNFGRVNLTLCVVLPYFQHTITSKDLRRLEKIPHI